MKYIFLLHLRGCSGGLPRSVNCPASVSAGQHVFSLEHSAARLHRGRVPAYCETSQTDHYVHYHR